MKVSVIIPSLNPDNKLVAVVDALLEEGFKDIIIVNDGSDEEHMAPFNEVAAHSECTILTHEVNKGKGRGLKTAFEFCLENRKDIDGVVTVDGDNQHRAKDIKKCSETMVWVILIRWKMMPLIVSEDIMANLHIKILLSIIVL